VLAVRGHRAVPVILLAVLLSSMSLGCAANSATPIPTPKPTPTATPTPTPTPTEVPTATPTPILNPNPTPSTLPLSSLNGSWAGTISTGEAISFQVLDGKINNLEFTYGIIGPQCSTDVQGSFSFATPITGPTFTETGTLEGYGGGLTTIVFSGAFDTGTSASGDLTISGTGPPCGKWSDGKATWKATR
jgi:hypothetical protein